MHTERITFHILLAKKREDNIALQPRGLITNVMLVTMFPNLQKIASIGVTLPVSTARGDYTIFSENLIFFPTCHNFFPLSSVQIIITPACCLLCVL